MFDRKLAFTLVFNFSAHAAPRYFRGASKFRQSFTGHLSLCLDDAGAKNDASLVVPAQLYTCCTSFWRLWSHCLCVNAFARHLSCVVWLLSRHPHWPGASKRQRTCDREGFNFISNHYAIAKKRRDPRHNEIMMQAEPSKRHWMWCFTDVSG